MFHARRESNSHATTPNDATARQSRACKSCKGFVGIDAVIAPIAAWKTLGTGTRRALSRSGGPTMIGSILLVVLILLLLGLLPSWPYSQSWGYAPSGTVGTVLLVVLILVLLGRI
jgi:hypothetical protein